MKKALVLFSMVALSSVSMAQTGSWYIGGVAGFSSSTTKNAATDKKDVTSSWAFGPEVGTFLKDDIQVGLILGFSGSMEKDDGEEVMKSSDISPTIYGRKFFKITDNFSTFGGLYLGYIGSKTKDEGQFGSDTEYKGSGFSARIGIGVAYALSPKFTAVGQYGLLGFQSVNYKSGSTDVSKDSGFDFGVNTVGSTTLSQGNGSGSVFNIGIYYTFMSK